MIQDEFKQLKKKEVEYINPPKEENKPVPEKKNTGEFDFSALLEQIKTVRRPVASAPTYTPKNFLEQFVLYSNGGVLRLYVYIDGGWAYTVLT